MTREALLGHRFRVHGARREIVRGTPLAAKLFGAPFLVAGALATYSGLTHDLLDPDSGEALGGWANALFVGFLAVPCLGFGLPAVLGRRAIVVDHGAGTLERWWGLVFPMIRRSRRLGATRRVILGLVTRTSGPPSGIGRRISTAHGVFLDGPGRYTLETFIREAPARRFAERAAETLDLPLEDRLLGAEPRSASELDVPLAQRLRARGGAKLPDAPAGSRVRVTPRPDGRTATLPPFGFDKAGAWLLLAALVAGWGWLTLDMWTAGGPIDLLFGAAITAVAISVGWKLFGDLLVREEVDVSREAIAVTRSLGPIPWRRSIPIDELEEIGFDGDAVRFVSDRRTLRVGGGHSEADCMYLAALVRAWLVELVPGH